MVEDAHALISLAYRHQRHVLKKTMNTIKKAQSCIKDLVTKLQKRTDELGALSDVVATFVIASIMDEEAAFCDEIIALLEKLIVRKNMAYLKLVEGTVNKKTFAFEILNDYLKSVLDTALQTLHSWPAAENRCACLIQPLEANSLTRKLWALQLPPETDHSQRTFDRDNALPSPRDGRTALTSVINRVSVMSSENLFCLTPLYRCKCCGTATSRRFAVSSI